MELHVAFATFWRVLGISRCLDVRPDVSHREALVLFAGARGAFPKILLALVEGQFLSTVNTHVFAGADFLSCAVCFLFGQGFHQTFTLS